MLNWADYVIIAALGLSVLMGLWRGFIGEVLALAVWIVAIWVAWTIGPQLAASLTAVSLPSARIALGYALCFIAVLIAGAIVGFFMRKLVAGSGLSGTDRLLGAIFGLARGLALVTLVVLLLGFTPFPRDPWWHESRLLPSFQNAAQWASAHMPADVTKYLDLRGLLPQPPQSEDKKPAPNEHKI
ncbi:CvpA family protein [Rudaea sp.]|uniref:CvpA family protein n=1 Tax=Rudaea sp. TaxID=2136325 RepID=UPI002ED36693